MARLPALAALPRTLNSTAQLKPKPYKTTLTSGIVSQTHLIFFELLFVREDNDRHCIFVEASSGTC
jgi:hypothetical protein